jgi:hypothetical protein
MVHVYGVGVVSKGGNNGVLQRSSYVALPHAITIGEVRWSNAGQYTR